MHSTSHAIGQKQIVPVFQRLWPGYTCKWLLCLLACLLAFNRFWLFVTPSICFVPGSLRLRSLFSAGYFLLVFGLYLLFKFFTTSFISLYSTTMRTWLRRSIIHMYKPCTYHYDCCIISLWIVMGHKTGTHRDQVKTHTLAATKLFRRFGTLTLRRPDPSQTWAIQTEPGHVEVLVYN